MALVEKAHRLMAVQSREMDRDMLAGLRRAGFRINDTDERGWQFMFLTRGGGYYFNVGCSELIIEGRVPVVQYADIETFNEAGWQTRDGRTQATDMIVLATGYHTQEAVVKKLFGEAIAARVGRVWGIDWDKQELNSMFTRTGQRGLWFIAGSFAQCRIYSKYLALHIKACEAGLVPPQLSEELSCSTN
jgi:putative flavoprotein involved in K+ transport